MALLDQVTGAYRKISRPGCAPAVGTANTDKSIPLLIRDMTAHFRLRVTSWIMSLLITSFGVIIIHNPMVLTTPESAPRYVYMMRVASVFSFILHNPAMLCGCFCLAIGLLRLGALIVNGTFSGFVWSFHVRALGSFLACFVWFQILLGVFFSHEWTLAVPVYCTFLAFDAFNLYVATFEINREHG